MISKHTYKSLVWIDVENPLSNELLRLQEEYQLPVQIRNTCSNNSPLKSVEVYRSRSFFFFSFIFPVSDTFQQVYFVLSDTFLITVHRGPIKVINEIYSVFEKDGLFDSEEKGNNVTSIFVYIVKSLYQDIHFNLANSKQIREAVNPHVEIIRFLISNLPEKNELLVLEHQYNLLSLNLKQSEQGVQTSEVSTLKNKLQDYKILFFITLALLILSML